MNNGLGKIVTGLVAIYALGVASFDAHSLIKYQSQKVVMDKDRKEIIGEMRSANMTMAFSSSMYDQASKDRLTARAKLRELEENYASLKEGLDTNLRNSYKSWLAFMK